MRLPFKVTYEDGREVEAVAKPKDIVAFERQYGVSFGDFASKVKAPPMEWLFYLAWSPLHRQGRETRAFDEFLDAVDQIEEQEEQPTVPFPTAPSDDSSPT